MMRRRGGRTTSPAGPPAAEAPLVTISAQLSDFEYALIIGTAAFHAWVVRCMTAAGFAALAAQDVLILHAVNHRARGRKLADICMVMHVEDPHVVSYSLKKLIAHGLVDFEKIGRERHYVATPRGDALCSEYRRVRDEILVRNLAWLDERQGTVPAAAGFLRTMTALYDQASRVATVERAPQPPRHR